MIDSLSSTAYSGTWFRPETQKSAAAPEEGDATADLPNPAAAAAPDAAGETQTGGQDDGQSAADGEEQSLLERILEVGFRAYAEEIRQEKIQELRDKILESMGLTEEDLQNMPPEERASIEKLIANEIAKRMAAQAELNGGEDGAQSTQMAYMHSQSTTVTTTEVRFSTLSLGALVGPGEGGQGLGPLLALQEEDAARAGGETGLTRAGDERGKNDRVDV